MAAISTSFGSSSSSSAYYYNHPSHVAGASFESTLADDEFVDLDGFEIEAADEKGEVNFEACEVKKVATDKSTAKVSAIIKGVVAKSSRQKAKEKLARQKQRSQDKIVATADAVLKEIAQKKADAALKVAQEAAAAAEKAAQEQLDRARGFSLIPLEQSVTKKSAAKPCYIDLTSYATDFKGYEASSMAMQHAAKRIELFQFTCKYLHQRASYLTEYTMPLNAKNQYVATAYTVPSDYVREERCELTERTHIAFLNKIVVQKDLKQYKLSGRVTFNDEAVSLEHVLNLCDIMPKTVNKVDWYVECYLRLDAVSLLDNVRKGTKTSQEAALDLSRLFEKSLKQLLAKVKAKDVTYTRRFQKPSVLFNKIFADNMKAMWKDVKIEAYINGMLAAVSQFNRVNSIISASTRAAATAASSAPATAASSAPATAASSAPATAASSAPATAASSAPATEVAASSTVSAATTAYVTPFASSTMNVFATPFAPRTMNVFATPFDPTAHQAEDTTFDD